MVENPFAFGYTPKVLDEKARDFRIADHPLLKGRRLKRETRKMWKMGPLLNQKSHPSCVGHAWTGELMAQPFADRDVSVDDGNAYALNHFRRTLRLYFDQWQGHEDGGSTIDGGAKVAVQRGLITEYRWAATISEIIDAVLHVGPVVIGIPWFNSMNQTGPNGRVRCTIREGAFNGGHAIVITGYDENSPIGEPAFRLRNSWGKFWGSELPGGDLSGNGWITPEDLERLFEYQSRPFNHQWIDSACLPSGRFNVDIETLLATHPDPNFS